MKPNCRAFSLIEILAVISILGALAAITYPVFTQVRRSAQKSACMSNLRQIGLAITVYRSQYDGSEVGTPAQMGLPPGQVAFSLLSGLKCHGTSSLENFGVGYHQYWPNPGSDQRMEAFWAKFVGHYAGSTILIGDPSHQPSADQLSASWQNWSCLGLLLDTSVIERRRLGYPFSLLWWQLNK